MPLTVVTSFTVLPARRPESLAWSLRIQEVDMHWRRRSEQRVRIPRIVRGSAMEGPGFYIWDEDAREVRRSGEELMRVVEARRSEASRRARERLRARGADAE